MTAYSQVCQRLGKAAYFPTVEVQIYILERALINPFNVQDFSLIIRD
jgi:hypothetical protein